MNLTPKEFYSELLLKTDLQFKRSPVYEFQKKKGKIWNYGICMTPIVQGMGIICGINYGGGNNNYNYIPPVYMPSGKGITEHRFIKQCRPYLKKYLNLDFKTINFNYTNFCSFRTPKENILTEKDYELSFPLFEEYVRFINPPWIFSIGNKNIEVLQNLKVLKNLKRHFDSENKFKGYSANLWDWRIYSVPHPVARLTITSRETIWRKVVAEIKKT